MCRLHVACLSRTVCDMRVPECLYASKLVGASQSCLQVTSGLDLLEKLVRISLGFILLYPFTTSVKYAGT